MAKKVKVDYAPGVTYQVDPTVWDLCEQVYRIVLLEESIPGKDPLEDSIKWYAKHYQGGVGEKEAKKIVRKNSLFFFPVIDVVYSMILDEIKKHGASKRPKKKDKKKQSGYDSDFVQNLTTNYVRHHIKQNPKGIWAKYYKTLKEKYTDKDKRDNRLAGRAQIKAYVVRALLEALEERNELPKAAFPK